MVANERVLFRMRSYQRRPWLALRAGTKRFVEVWHRRAGKDRTWLNITLLEMMGKMGYYFHVFPSLVQARRDVWDNIIHSNYNGVLTPMRMIDTFPKELVKERNETEMAITLVNGSRWQLMGADSEDAIARMRGPNPIGIVCSEYAFMEYDPWPVLSPILLENGGWVAFISTPNVEDDNFHKLYKNALVDSKWFSQLLTINDTRRDAEGEDGAPVINLEDINELRNQNIREEEIQREYYCSFRGYLHGTIYGDVLEQARIAKRVSRFPYINTLPVGVAFDLGHSDLTACWFYQRPPDGRVIFIDYHEETLKDIGWWARFLREHKPYSYGRVLLPWDGRSAEVYLSSLGFRNIQLVERTKSIQSDIDQVRRNFGTYYFDEVACAKGLEHLAKYRREFDKEKLVFLKQPVHDVHSHAADGLRTGEMGRWEPLYGTIDWDKPIKVISEFDPRGVQ